MKQQAARFLIFSCKLHKRNIKEKERRKIAAEEAKKNAKKPTSRKGTIKKIPSAAVTTPTAKLATTSPASAAKAGESKNGALEPKFSSDLSKTMQPKLNSENSKSSLK